MAEQNHKNIGIEELVGNLELSFKFFIDSTLRAIPNKTDAQRAKIFSESLSPISLMYMFVFIHAAFKKNGYSDVQDITVSMCRVKIYWMVR